jgi:hypothetical protein
MNLNQWEVIAELAEQYSSPKITHGSFVFLKEEKSAIVCFYECGQIKSCTYSNRVGYHRPHQEGPANQIFYRDGNISCTQYFLDGLLYRPPHLGPAYKSLYQDGRVLLAEYWQYGKKFAPLQSAPL